MALSSEIGRVIANSRRFIGKTKPPETARLLENITTVDTKTHQFDSSTVKSGS